MEELADKRLAPQELDKQNNLKETKKTNIFKMLIETKKTPDFADFIISKQ